MDERFMSKRPQTALVKLLSGLFASDTDVFPKGCGSFEKLKGDNSILGSRCAEWGKENGAYHVGKWGHEGYKEL